MASSSSETSFPTDSISRDDLHSFTDHLQSSTRILALLGAGLSASSGLPTFRGKGGLWRTFPSTSLATPEAFEENPALSWQFYSWRRHASLSVFPNRAHLALAELARKKAGFLCLSQNVDGLSVRAEHPEGQLKLLHGSLFDTKCSDEDCGYIIKDDFRDPIMPALAMPEAKEDAAEVMKNTAEEAQDDAGVANKKAPHAEKKATAQSTTKSTTAPDLSDPNTPLPEVKHSDLPLCPQCKTALLRPGVVWFGEPLPSPTINSAHAWIDASPRIDLMLVIGTSSVVYPAAGYTDVARRKGARVAVVNMDADTVGLTSRDWLFQGDAAEIVPLILESVVGRVPRWEESEEAERDPIKRAQM